MLVDLRIDGRVRTALIQTGKMGWGVVLDRQTGEFLHAFKTAYDNVVTGWTPQGRPIVNPAVIPTPADIDSGKVFEVCPHLHGARNLQAPSFSRETGLYYLGINNSCMEAKLVPTAYVRGRAYTGFTPIAKRVPGYDYVGEFVAFDPVTGRRAWTYRSPTGAAMTASALATAGGIVFGGTADREFFALHSETGELLWQTRLNGDVSGAPITFEVGGVQYVAITAGGRTGPTTSFGPLTNVTLSEGTGAVWVFAVSSDAERRMSRRGPGTAILRSTSGNALAAGQVAAVVAPVQPSAQPSTPPPAGSPTLDGVFTREQALRGEQRFKQACTTCHSIDEQAGALRSKWGNATLADLFTAISTTMPQNAPGSLPQDAYASIVAYYLQQGGYAPGAAELPASPPTLTRFRIPAR